MRFLDSLNTASKYLSAYKNEQIADYDNKRAEMLKWKTSVEKSDYKKLRADLFQALKENNAEIEEMTLFSKAQKILDKVYICVFLRKQKASA